MDEHINGWEIDIQNHLQSLRKRRTSWKEGKPLAGRIEWDEMGWDAVVGPRSWSRNNVKRGLKPWKGVGDKTEQSRSFH